MWIWMFLLPISLVILMVNCIVNKKLLNVISLVSLFVGLICYIYEISIRIKADDMSAISDIYPTTNAYLIIYLIIYLLIMLIQLIYIGRRNKE